MKNRWIKHDSVTSTNSLLSDLLKQKQVGEGDIVIADYQHGGRGLGDHSWVSNREENLLMSLLLFPAFLSASEQFHLSRVASLALCDTLETLGVEAVIKWPNDILTRRGKIAGILIENGISGGTISHTIIGIGMNLNQILFPDFEVPATSLTLETGKNVDVSGFGEMLAKDLIRHYQALKVGHTHQLEKEYMDRLYLAGVPAVFKTKEGDFDGTIKGVTDYGELMIACEDGVRTFGHGFISIPLTFDNL